jgi:phage terminase large subunit-like protein
VWLLLAGRGFGKTRTGAEWVLELAREHPGAGSR